MSYGRLSTRVLKARSLAVRFPGRHTIKRRLMNRKYPTLADRRIQGYETFPVPRRR